jgi:hypothetical protein
MRLSHRLIAMVAMAGICGIAIADDSLLAVKRGEEPWVARKNNYFSAMIKGDTNGPHVIRLRLPAGWKYSPHYQTGQEDITVIAGTFYFAVGDTFDESKLVAYPAGSFLSIPANLLHFALTKGEELVLQIESLGPSKELEVKKD